MQRSLSAGIALFLAVASAEVLIRVAVVSDLGSSHEQVLLSLAVGGLAASCVSLAALLVSRTRSRSVARFRRSA